MNMFNFLAFKSSSIPLSFKALYKPPLPSGDSQMAFLDCNKILLPSKLKHGKSTLIEKR